MSLLVIGTAALDSVRTPFGEREEVLGGSAVYFAVAASFFTSVRLVAAVGEDFPEAHLHLLAGRGIDLSGLRRLPGRTFRWRGEYGYDLNEAHTLDTQLNVLERFDARLTDAEAATPYAFLANIDPVLQQRVRQRMRGARLLAADTMNFWIERQRPDLLAVLHDLDLLIINDAEARMLANQPSLPRAARDILRLGPRALIVKRGEYGVALFGEGGPFAAPALPLEEVADPTGAGDSFAGGLMGHLAASGRHDAATLRQAVIYGSVMASFNVEDFSLSRLLRLTRAEVDERFRHLTALMHFDPIDPATP